MSSKHCAKGANVSIVALDESIGINNNSHVEVVARYCSNREVHEELCCSKPKYGTTKGKILFRQSPYSFFYSDLTS